MTVLLIEHPTPPLEKNDYKQAISITKRDHNGTNSRTSVSSQTAIS